MKKVLFISVLNANQCIQLLSCFESVGNQKESIFFCSGRTGRFRQRRFEWPRQEIEYFQRKRCAFRIAKNPPQKVCGKSPFAAVRFTHHYNLHSFSYFRPLFIAVRSRWLDRRTWQPRQGRRRHRWWRRWMLVTLTRSNRSCWRRCGARFNKRNKKSSTVRHTCLSNHWRLTCNEETV